MPLSLGPGSIGRRLLRHVHESGQPALARQHMHRMEELLQTGEPLPITVGVLTAVLGSMLIARA